MQTLQTKANVSVLLTKCYKAGFAILLAQTAFAAEKANEQAKVETPPTQEPNIMKNVIMAGMIVAGIALVVTANKKPEEKIVQPSVADLRKVQPKGESKVVFEDDYEGSFSSAKKKKGKKIVEQSDSDPEVVEDDGNDDWNDKEDDGSVEEVEDFSEDESDEPQQK